MLGTSSSDKKMPKRHSMVRWYQPSLLAQMAIRAMIAKAVGQIADNREIQAALDPLKDSELNGAYDFSGSHAGQDYYLDYVADIGDGWDSTFAVASQLAQAELSVSGEEDALSRGEILIMGGDEVYPSPSMQAYQERSLGPYRIACQHAQLGASSQQPYLFALPGNHDWYDGLQSFSNIFCQARGHQSDPEMCTIADWKTCQTRSYFCIKLPHDWWLCGIDIQLGAGVNTTQLDYFREIAKVQIGKDAKIILCCAQPEWVLAEIREKDMMQSFSEFMQVLTPTGAKIRLVLAGDLHHYSRYESEADGATFVTAGGGGAFLHPTHKLPETLGVDAQKRPKLKLAHCYPDKKTSFRLSNKLSLFTFINLKFSMLIGLVYTLLAWIFEARTLSIGAPMSDTFMEWYDGHANVFHVLQVFFTTIPRSPEVALIVVAIYYGFIKFNLTQRTRLSVSLGVGHAMAHFLPFFMSYFLATCAAAYFQSEWIPMLNERTPFLVFIGVMFILATLLGGIVFGAYLWLALNVFGLQWTNAFSALRIKDYKNFLRLRINQDGSLTVFPMKIDKVGRSKDSQKLAQSTRAELTEKPYNIQ